MDRYLLFALTILRPDEHFTWYLGYGILLQWYHRFVFCNHLSSLPGHVAVRGHNPDFVMSLLWLYRMVKNINIGIKKQLLFYLYYKIKISNSGSHKVGVTDDCSKQECLALPPTMIHIIEAKLFFWHTIPRISGEMFIWPQDACLRMVTSQSFFDKITVQ
jgi:hypothetical protein